jgi:molybdate transport system substrate-binding protein
MLPQATWGREQLKPGLSWIGALAVWLATTLAMLAATLAPSASAEIRVFTSGAPAAVERDIATEFSRMTGHQVTVTVGNLSAIQDKLSAGESPDIVIFPTPAIETLGKAGKLDIGSQVDLARVGIGIAVREGAPLPDISSVDAVGKLLLNARSIVHPDPVGGGFTGAHIARMIERMGIADAVKPKVTLLFAIGGGVAAVAKGDAEIGIFNISEILPVKGVKLAGPLPAELQNYITFSGAVYAGSAAREPARAFLQRLSDASARDSWTKWGFESLGAGR